MLCLLLHFGNASFWFIVVSILKLNPRFCKSGDTTYCLAHYMLKCLVIIHLAALRPHFRMFLKSAPSLAPVFYNFFFLMYSNFIKTYKSQNETFSRIDSSKINSFFIEYIIKKWRKGRTEDKNIQSCSRASG